MGHTSTFKGRVSSNAQRQKNESSSYGYLSLPGNVHVFNPKPGSKVTLDFLPYVVTNPKHPDRDEKSKAAMPDTLWYKRPFKVHRGVGPSNESVVCLAYEGKPCPICEYRERRKKAGAPQDELDALKPSLRNLYIVVPLDVDDAEAVPHVMDISQAMFQKKLIEELEENDDNEIFPDIEEGKSVRIRFESKQIGTGKPFAEAGRIDFLERKKQYKESIVDKLPDLDKLLIILPYKELDAKFSNEDVEEDDEREEARNSRFREEPEEEKEERHSRHAERETEKEEKEEELTWDDLEKKSQRALSRLVRDENLDIDVEKFDDEEELRLEIAKELGIKPPKKQEKEEKEERGGRSSKREDKKDNKCPYGHTFGTDHDAFPNDCDECKVWNECYDQKKKSK